VKICNVCGASNEAEAEFCGTCGNRLAASPATTAPSNPAAPEGAQEPGPTPDPVATATEVVATPVDDDVVVPGSTPNAKARVDCLL
jgi:hypothetical protein